MKLAEQFFSTASKISAERELEAQKKYLPQAELLYNDMISVCKERAEKGSMSAYYAFVFFTSLQEYIFEPKAIEIAEKKLLNEGFTFDRDFHKEESPIYTLKYSYTIYWDMKRFKPFKKEE